MNDAQWFLALTLRERAAIISANPSPSCEEFDEAVSARRIARWRSQSPFQDDSLFAYRLSSIPLVDLRTFELVLGTPPSYFAKHYGSELKWLQFLRDAYLGSSTNDPAASEASAFQEDPLGTLPLTRPLLMRWRERFTSSIQSLVEDWETAPFEVDRIVDLFSMDLARRISNMVNGAVALEVNIARVSESIAGATSEARFQYFMSGLSEPAAALEFFNQYPVLARQLVSLCDLSLTFATDFLHQLREDWEAIVAVFRGAASCGELSHIRFAAGDRHRGARSVLILEFSTGFRIVYKPRSLQADVCFDELVGWINSHGVHHQLRRLSIISREDRGWVEFVEPSACDSLEQVEQFYWRTGGWLAVFYALEATDFHFENLIAAGEHAVPVDLESLFHKRVDHADGEAGDEVPTGDLSSSVLRVGILPHKIWMNAESNGVDISGLGGESGQVLPERVPRWEAGRSDLMNLTPTRATLAPAENRPSLRGNDVDMLDFAPFLEKGFEDVYRVILANRTDLLSQRGALAAFAGAEVRSIFRPSRIYGLLLQVAFHPDYLQDALQRDRLFDKLWLATQNEFRLRRLIEDERRDLERADVPIFTTRVDSRHVWNSFGKCHENILSRSGLSLAREKIQSMSSADLKRQTWYVRAALATASKTLHPQKRVEKVNPLVLGKRPAISVKEEACSAASRLLAMAHHGPDGYSWIGLQAHFEGYWTLDSLGVDLYCGLPGIALFLAYLGRCTGDSSYTAAARLTLESAQRQWREHPSAVAGVGAFDGWGGILYTITHLAALWDDRDLVAEAERIVELLPERIESDESDDIVSGTAGCLVTLLGYDSVFPSRAARAAALLCGMRLVARGQVMDVGRGWPRRLDGIPLGGFSHGASGVAWALLRLAAALPDRNATFVSTARGALDYEDSLFSEKLGTWRDLRPAAGGGEETPSRQPVTAWCHGASGIGISLIEAMRHFRDPRLAHRLTTALEVTERHGFGMSHCLCHGDLGNLELITLAMGIPGWRAWEETHRKVSAVVANEMATEGFRCGVSVDAENPGLMNGLAGIGFGLLRLTWPRCVPSVLTLAPPQRARSR